MECETVEAYINSNSSPCLMKSEEDKGLHKYHYANAVIIFRYNIRIILIFKETRM